MDPVAAIGLAQQCFELAKAIFEYVQAVKGASAERRILSAEMQNIANLVHLLIDLKVPGTGSQDDASKLPGEIHGPMDRMAKRLHDISAKLDIKVNQAMPGSMQRASPLVTSPTSGGHRFWRDSKKKMHEIKTDLKWPFTKDEIVAELNGLERDKTFMMLYLQSNNYMLAQATQDGVEMVQEGVTDIRHTVKATDHKVGVLLESHLDEKTNRVLQWLSNLDFAARHRELCAEREIQEPTGQWFLETPQFQSWMAGTERLIYATGVAGSGKTMISSIAIESIVAHQATAPIAFVFFDHKLQKEHGKATIMADILKQFLRLDGVIPSDILYSYEKRHRSGEPPDTKDVMKALITWIGAKDKVYIVLDALDEFSVSEKERSTFLDDVFNILELEKVYLFITSRPNSVSHQKLDTVEAIQIRAQPEDVRRYLQPRMDYMPQVLRRNIELQEFVINAICGKVQDMFILAQYHLRAVEAARSRKEIEQAINELPTGQEGLDELYGRCLERIDRQSIIHRQRLHRMLDLLVCSRRPLRPDELLEALTLDFKTMTVDSEDQVDIADLVSDCEGLVSLDDKGRVLRLAHATVHEYLLRIEANKKSECRVAYLCLRYLSMAPLLKTYAHKKAYDVNVWEKFIFFDYAARYWGEHVKSGMALESELEGEVLDFLDLPYRACDGYTGKWIMETSIQRGLEIWKGEGFDRGGHHKTMARAKLRLPRIHHAIFFGLTNILQRLLEEGDDPNAIDPDGNFLALNAAVQANRFDETKLLLDNGAKPNIVGNSRSPLNWAAECSSLEIVKLLVRRGANLDQQKEHTDPPLCCACERDRDDVVDFLIRKGADIDNFTARKLDAYRTPLSYVMDRGRPKCRELLLFKHKVMTPKRGRLILMPVEDAGIVCRLIQEAKTSPHQTFGLGQGALDIALRLQDTKLIEMCLEAGVKPRVYHNLENISALADLQVRCPRLKDLLAQQVPPTLTVHEELKDWKSGYEHASRVVLRFELPTTTFNGPPSKIIFTIVSHDQGWSNYPHDHGTYHGGSSVFHAALYHNNEQPGSSKTVVTKIRPRIVQNVHASFEWKEHVVVWEREDSRDEVRRWMEHALPGRWIRVIAGAADEGWENHVKEVKVQIWA